MQQRPSHLTPHQQQRKGWITFCLARPQPYVTTEDSHYSRYSGQARSFQGAETPDFSEPPHHCLTSDVRQTGCPRRDRESVLSTWKSTAGDDLSETHPPARPHLKCDILSPTRWLACSQAAGPCSGPDRRASAKRELRGLPVQAGGGRRMCDLG